MKKIHISDIIQIVSNIRNQSISDIQSKSRKRELSESRHIICFIGQFANLSLRTIGSALSDRDHATIIHGRDKAVDIMQYDENFKKQVNEAILCLRLDHIR
jgi:chromosomal replication initiator protein